LEEDLDAFLNTCQETRTHPGRWCCGKTLMQTFLGTVPLAKEKLQAA
jgi:hypothetical protein